MTEMSPVVAVNAPGFRDGKEIQIGTKHGTVGLPIPGVAVRIVDLETVSAGNIAPLRPGQLTGGPFQRRGAVLA